MMMTKVSKSTFCLLFFFLFALSLVKAQGADNVAWLSPISASTEIKKDWTVSLTPILRLNEDFSEYQNFSLDYTLKKKIDAHWSFELLGRTWFLPNGTNRQFLWPAVSYSHKVKDIAWSHRVRWHQAFDIEDRTDPDFIRYFQSLKYTGWGKLQPFIGLELWWGLNGTLQIERLRYIPGVQYKINDKLNLTVALWRQETLNLDPEIDVNLWRLNLAYKLPALWKKE